jgi:hypothetical protein
MQERHVFWPLIIAGWSGFYVMMVELLGGRFIAPYFGSSVYVWGSIIFIFMVGLAIGYLLGGIYSRHNPSVVRLCGILMASATTTLPMLIFGESLLNVVFLNISDPRTGSLLACVLLYFIPTIFAGMVSPYAIRIIIQNRETSGYDAGYLYFVSTVGSSAGTLLTAFYFVLWFEVNMILLAGIGTSYLLGGLGMVFNARKG